jgi:hypothetical protein
VGDGYVVESSCRLVTYTPLTYVIAQSQGLLFMIQYVRHNWSEVDAKGTCLMLVPP